ncbi:hypothetical protein [Streptomyces sp. PanSC19]|uniref:hypothetical protein n=1 Tax=Streptomyces sp. PanSC19 TaxID=1520455 RepID=UPI0021A41AA3|nr:hypothetical protein [Streptomyces sp. PanSC19]
MTPPFTPLTAQPAWVHFEKIFLRNGGLKVTHALVCALLGFFLAGTDMAPTIHNGVAATAEMVSSHRP